MKPSQTWKLPTSYQADSTESQRESGLTYIEVIPKIDYDYLNDEFRKAVKFLREGKAKFTPSTTNSFVDDFLHKWENL